MNAARWCGAVCLAVLAAAATVAQEGRIGAAEEFATMDGWQVTRNRFADLRAEDVLGVFETHIHNLPLTSSGRVGRLRSVHAREATTMRFAFAILPEKGKRR